MAEYPFWRVQNMAGFRQCFTVQLAADVNDRRTRALLLMKCDKKIPAVVVEANDATHWLICIERVQKTTTLDPASARSWQGKDKIATVFN